MSNRSPKRPKPKKLPWSEGTVTIRPWTLTLTAATLIGGLSALLALLPRVTVTVSDPPNPDDPFSASATVTNTGFIPLDSVTPSVSVKSIQTKSGFSSNTIEASPYSMRIRRNIWQPQDLGLDEKFTVALNDVYGVPPADLQSADIAIWVDYELPIIHWKRDKVFPLVAHKQSNGKFYWYAKTAK